MLTVISIPIAIASISFCLFIVVLKLLMKGKVFQNEIPGLFILCYLFSAALQFGYLLNSQVEFPISEMLVLNAYIFLLPITYLAYRLKYLNEKLQKQHYVHFIAPIIFLTQTLWLLM